MPKSLARLREREGARRAAAGRVRVLGRARVKIHRAWYYVHFNPVKHGLVINVCNWPFSSFRRVVASGYSPADCGGGEDGIGGVRRKTGGMKPYESGRVPKSIQPYAPASSGKRLIPVISRRSGAARKRIRERQIVFLCLDDAINVGSEGYKRVDT
jgi:hypothetical protein